MYSIYMFTISELENAQMTTQTTEPQEEKKTSKKIFKQGLINMGSYWYWGDTSKLHCIIVSFFLNLILLFIIILIYVILKFHDTAKNMAMLIGLTMLIGTISCTALCAVLIWLCPIVASITCPVIIITTIILTGFKSYLYNNKYKVGYVPFIVVAVILVGLWITWLYLWNYSRAVFWTMIGAAVIDTTILLYLIKKKKKL